MITISLDEYGEFEKDDFSPLFIAGIIFDDKEDKEELNIERMRIRAYYRSIMSDLGSEFQYPRDLHSNGNKYRDRTVVALVKDLVRKTFPDFIMNGTYKDTILYGDGGKILRNRRGKYHLFVMLKSDDGKKKLLSKNVSIFARDDWAANRYFHMASSVVNRLLFHNPIYVNENMPMINIDIATRSTGLINEMDEKLADEFAQQAYKIKDECKNNQYSIMNTEIYRTIILQEIINSNSESAKIKKLSVRSIIYSAKKKDMEFLYLSDSFCSSLQYRTQNKSADNCLQSILQRVKNINPEETNLVFGYDEIDNDFSYAWNCCEKKDYFEALSTTYYSTKKNGKFAEYYNKIWFPYIEKFIVECIEPEEYVRCVDELSSLLMTNNLDIECLLYLFQQLESMATTIRDKFGSKDMYSRIMYKLYDVGVAVFCHKGNSKKALKYYKMCQEYVFYVGMDDFLKTNNRLIVCLEDSLEWNKAEQLAEENVRKQELLSELKRKAWNRDGESYYLDEAKSLSQLGRILAEKRKGKAEDYFRRALEMMEKGSANYKITQSYLLHFYADMNMKDEFDHEIVDYFNGITDYFDMLNYVIRIESESHAVYSKEYALYILLRGLLYFHIDSVDNHMWQTLSRIDEIIKEKDINEPENHPWEIIYKYLELISYSRQDCASETKFSKLRTKCIKESGDIIKALTMYGEVEIAHYKGNIRSRDSYSNKLASFIKSNFDSLRKASFSTNGDERFEELGDYFSFMFR